jgi:plastocyanin
MRGAHRRTLTREGRPKGRTSGHVSGSSSSRRQPGLTCSAQPMTLALGIAVAAGLLLGLAACHPSPEAPRDPEVAAFLGVPETTPIYRFDVVVRDGRSVLFPRTHEVEAGGWVQFVSVGHRVHSVHFRKEAFENPEGWRFLESTYQTASPPLTEDGARFVISFEGAPAGAYPFRIEGQGLPVDGVIRVR